MSQTGEIDELAIAHASDTEWFVRRGMRKGYQLLSLATPPIYAAFVLTRKGRSHFSVNRFMRATWIGGAGGVAAGGAFEYGRSATSSAETLRARRIRAHYDNVSMRADDHSTIGALIFSVLTPAIFYKRARVAHLILGGAGLGSGIGLLTHWGKILSGDVPQPDVVPIPAPSAPSTAES